MSEIKAIETVYNGYKFRSRLEARWAVFFDAAGIKYEYEPQGFELSDGTKYLPDFYLKDFNMYAEVKPFDLNRIDEILKTFKFIQRNGAISKIIYLPEIPEIEDDTNEYWYLCIYWSDLFDSAVLQRIPIYDEERGSGNVVQILPVFSFRDSGTVCYPWINSSKDREFNLDALKRMKYWEAIHVSMITTRKSEIFNNYIQETKLTTLAYKAAKQARFEYGECG